MKLLSRKWNMDFLTKDWKFGKDTGLLLLRAVFGFLLIYGHGSYKWGTILSGQEIQFGDPIGIGTHLSFYLAAFAEGIAALLLIMGLFARYAAIILTINFIVILMVHAIFLKDGFGILEMRFMFTTVFFALIFTGPGKFSLDYSLFKRQKDG